MAMRSSSGTVAPAKSSWQGKLDGFYIGFFAFHLVVIFAVDIVPLYPEPFVPGPLLKLREFYIAKYQDRFFVDPPRWFQSYAVMEAVYHVPASIEIIRGLLKDDAFVPVHILVFAVQVFITTLTCLVEVWAWTDRTVEQKSDLSMIYGPYLAFAGLMGLDMMYRLRVALRKAKRD
ncbi:hypothetical protein LOZ12_002659 [Ophidiomyces ophidiicola]|nr:hypothetical protein LOZ64_001977 [Ophidiomyces ophidiicola]KAI1927342.1 hypothetical protein LOZ60_003116 [Ophidiomyces ophidiicola]KAI1946330.1 hypothetical protein LOZ62_003338 [Ophidiomyces ophidiicola]KAI1980097.1 hypothetical protein LOZ55_001497 [Ophidiomyces ophidiicola]KAI1986061.1 hypothetical protein LOZ54_004009 [Ophidiomyces ophidiicola]